MSVSREIGPGEHLWLIDAVYRLDGLAPPPPPPPAASDSTAAVSRLVGPFRACAAALGRADTVRALALYEPMVDAVGGESGPNRDAAWCDVMVGLAALIRVAGEHGRSAVLLHRLDRALAVGAPLRVAWSHCRALSEYARLAPGSVPERIVIVIDGLPAFLATYAVRAFGYLGDELGWLANDGRAVGVHVLATADRYASLPSELRSAFRRRLVLRQSSVDDYAAFGLRVGDDEIELPPGRGYLDADEVQVAVVGGSPDGAHHVIRSCSCRPCRRPAPPAPGATPV